MKKEMFTIRTSTGQKMQVKGNAIDILGLPCFVYKNESLRWTVSELTSGLSIAEALGPKWQIIKRAEEAVTNYGLARVQEIAKNAVDKNGACNG